MFMKRLFLRHTIHTVFTDELRVLRRILIGMGMAPNEGEDLLQDVYQESLEHPPEDRGQTALRHWLRRVTVNRALLHFRRQRVQERALAAMPEAQRHAVPGPSALAIEDEETKILRECLTQMQEALRVPLVLRHFCDWNATQIGQVLDIKPGTVRKRLYDARIQLAKMLAGRGVTS